MKFQTVQRIICCFMAFLFLCFAVVRPIEASADIIAATGTLCLVDPAILIPALLVTLGIAVVSSDEFQSLCSDITNSVSSWFHVSDGKNYLPVTEYNGSYYIDSALAQQIHSEALEAIGVSYGFSDKKLTYFQEAVEGTEAKFGADCIDYFAYSDCYLARVVCSGEPVRTFLVFTNGDCEISTAEFGANIDGETLQALTLTTESAFAAVAYSSEYCNIWTSSVAGSSDKLFTAPAVVVSSIYSAGIVYHPTHGLSVSDVIGSTLDADVYEDVVSGAIIVDNVVSIPVSIADDDVIATTTTAVVDSSTVSGSGDVATDGWLSSILEWLKRIWNSIISLASSITNPITTAISNLVASITSLWDTATTAITSSISDVIGSLADILEWIYAFPSELWQAIVDALSACFVPSEGYLDAKITELRNGFPLFDSIIDTATVLKNFFVSFGSTPPIIYIPLGDSTSWVLGGTTIFVDLTWYAQYKPTVDLLISAFLWLFFLWRVFLSLPGIIRGTSGLVGSISVITNNTSGSSDTSIR